MTESLFWEDHWAKIIEAIGEDLNRPGLADTPKRAAGAFKFLTQGYSQSVDSVVNGALFPSESSEMISGSGYRALFPVRTSPVTLHR